MTERGPLTEAELRRCIDLIYLINDADAAPAAAGNAAQDLLVELGALVGSDSVSCTRLALAPGDVIESMSCIGGDSGGAGTAAALGGALAAVADPANSELASSAELVTAVGEHPAFAAHRAGRLTAGASRAASELATLRDLRRLPLFVDFYEPQGIRDQLLAVLPLTAAQGVIVSVNRSWPGFSARDHAILDLITPHLRQAIARQRRIAALTSAARQAGELHTPGSRQASGSLRVLTARELEIAGLLAQGLTNREIARALTISPRTVHKHLEQVYRKLGTGNRTTTAALVHEAAGLVLRPTAPSYSSGPGVPLHR